MTARPFSLVILTSASGWTGSGISFAKIARGLTDRGHPTLVAATYPPVVTGLAAEGVAVTEVQLRHTGVREVLRLRAVLAGHAADLVLVDTPRDLRLAVLAGLWARCPVVYRYNQNFRRPRKDLSYRLFARGVAATVYLSEFIERDATAEGVRYGGRSYRIPNGFDTDVFTPSRDHAAAFRQRFGLESGDPVVLSAGKLVSGKRLDRGIDALARVRLEGRALTYVLCGDGPEEARLSEMAKRAGVRVLFTGMIDQTTLRGAYNAADLVLHTGKETFGNVVGEAMSCGRAVVCVSEGAAPEVVGQDGDAGVLVQPDDRDVLASAVTRLLSDRDRRNTIGAAARRRIEQVFPLHRMVSGYEDMFASVLSRT